jgi:hypothetical protein
MLMESYGRNRKLQKTLNQRRIDIQVELIVLLIVHL